MKNRRGDMLVENVMFIVLNLIFLAILFGFVYLQGSGTIVLEQSYAKNIALLVDSAKPITEMTLDMKTAFDLAEHNGIERDKIVTITGGRVLVKLSPASGYTYSFFNDVDVSAYPNTEPSTLYIIKVNGYNK